MAHKERGLKEHHGGYELDLSLHEGERVHSPHALVEAADGLDDVKTEPLAFEAKLNLAD